MNEDNSFNLLDEPWIPVLTHLDGPQTVSIATIFNDIPSNVVDLALNPYERVAVYRLLLCIAQAALGPDRLKDEKAWRAAKVGLFPAVAEYLKKWHDRFYLYGHRAFLQPDCVSPAKADGATPCDKLLFHLASGNNSTLFDHGAVGGTRAFSDAELALGLLAHQSFSAGGLSGQCIWDGVSTEKFIQAAPCREKSMLFSLIQDRSVVETVWLNLVTADRVRDSLKVEQGRPFWEFDGLSRSAVSGNEKTFLGRLVPLSRVVKLTQGSPTCILGGALAYPQFPEFRDPMASVKLQKGAKKDEFVPSYVSANPARMPWRELSSILEVRDVGGRKSALALKHLESIPGEKEFVLWTGGLYSDKAKEVDTVEWKVRLSVSLLEESATERYENAVAWADRQSGRLAVAVNAYSETLKMSTVKRGNIEVYGLTVSAKKCFWDLLARPENQKLVLAVDSPTYVDDWKQAARRAAEEAYRRACPATAARQMEAYAQGFSKLNIREDE